jgi:sn-glycerol 3-phosphate transport system permease protein
MWRAITVLTPTRRAHLHEALLAAAFVAPSLVLLAVFTFYPLLRSAYLALYRTDPFGHVRVFVGLTQYWDELRSPAFRTSLLVTAQFALYTVPTGLALGLLLAVLGNQRLRGIGVFRMIFSSSIASSVAVASVMWLTLLHPNIGVINYAVRELGGRPITWLNDPKWALVAVSLTTIWLNLGFTFIVIIAGLQAIPEELYESARIDGAGTIACFRYITLPMLSPTLVFATVVLTIVAFESFGQIDILTQGGPLNRTNVLVYSIYSEAFRHFNQGVAAARAVILFLIVLALSLAQFRFLEKRTFYGYMGE